MYCFRPLIKEYMEVDNSIFLKKSFAGRIMSNYINNDSCFAYKETRIKTIKALLGEYIERDSVVNNNRSDKLFSFNLVTGERLKTPVKNFLLNHSLPVFKEDIPNFTDTVGIASHRSSKEAIENALSEYLERQSLVMTWLGKLKSVPINIDSIKDIIDVYRPDLKSYNFFIRDISLWDFFKVIIFIGYNEESNKFIIGCNGNANFEKALIGAYREAMIMEHYFNYDQEYKYNKKISGIDNKLEHDDIYSDYFYSQSLADFKSNIKFLIENTKKIPEGYFEKKQFKYTDLKNTEMNFFCTIIPVNNDQKLKTVKVFSPDGFPHMNTKILEPQDYNISNILKIKRFPNKHRYLPFP